MHEVLAHKSLSGGCGLKETLRFALIFYGYRLAVASHRFLQLEFTTFLGDNMYESRGMGIFLHF